jgi:hypothetical protein
MYAMHVMIALPMIAAFAGGTAVAAVAAAGASDPESALIRATALDCIERFYTGDANRMERALHPELAKRIVITDPGSSLSRLDQMSAMTLVQRTRAGNGKKIAPNRRLEEVTILDRYQNVAAVKIVASDWIDYLQMAKFNGDWKIVNVLWELKPSSAEQTK